MANYQLKLKERRIADRKLLTGLWPGRLMNDGRDVSSRPVDISEHGLGILSSRELKIGSICILVMKDRSIEFEVKWMQPDFGKHDLFRYGLLCRETVINVIEEFATRGCFK